MERPNFKRGQVWYAVPSTQAKGHLQAGPRPVIIVSNNAANKHSGVLLVVPCTSKLKKNLPTHVSFHIRGTYNCAICEQVGPVLIEDLKSPMTTLDEDTMEEIDHAIQVALGLLPPVYIN